MNVEKDIKTVEDGIMSWDVEHCVVDAFDRIKKVLSEARLVSLNLTAAPCPFHEIGKSCKYDGNDCCFEEPCDVLLNRENNA